MTVDARRQERPGSFGTFIINHFALFPTIAGTATTTIALPTLVRNQRFVDGQVSQLTLVVPTSGTCTVLIKKWDHVNSAFVSLTAATDLTTTGQVLKVVTAIPALTTLTDVQRLIVAGDTLYADFVASAAITTQPTGGQIGYETFLL